VAGAFGPTAGALSGPVFDDRINWFLINDKQAGASAEGAKRLSLWLLGQQFDEQYVYFEAIKNLLLNTERKTNEMVLWHHFIGLHLKEKLKSLVTKLISIDAKFSLIYGFI